MKSGVNLDGAPVEDTSRSVFPVFSSYIHESLQGYAVQAQLLSMGGYAAWTVNAGQVCRASQFANRALRLNDSGVGYYVAFMANTFCGSSLPTKTPTTGGRIFGYADWLFNSWPLPPLPTGRASLLGLGRSFVARRKEVVRDLRVAEMTDPAPSDRVWVGDQGRPARSIHRYPSSLRTPDSMLMAV